MRSGFALLACAIGLALAWPTAALAQRTLSLNGQPVDKAPVVPKVPAVDPATLQSLPSARDFRPPEGVAFRAADFVSDNVRLTAQWVWAPKTEGGNDGKTLPTIIMAPGWGATAASLRQDAVELARAGYLVMLFDYRGWGDSDGRVALTGQKPATAGGAAFTAEVREQRGYIDPGEQSEDWFNAVSYAMTQPMVDTGRVGLSGSDLGGGYVIYAAAHDPRIKALVSEVTRADLRPAKPYQPDPAKVMAEADAAAAAIANGQSAYPAERARVPNGQGGSLVGAPVGNKSPRWTPVDEADGVTAPTLFVLAQKEELFSNVFNGQLACERVQGPRKMVMLGEATHYDLYGQERDRALQLSLAWFDKYLKPAAAPAQATGKRKDPERGACNPPPLPPAGEEKKEGSGVGHKAPSTTDRFN